MTDKELVTLKELQKITGISDRILLTLLERNSLQISLDADQGVLVDLASASVQKLIQVAVETQQTMLDRYRDIFVEQCAQILSDSLDDIVSEAILNLPSD